MAGILHVRAIHTCAGQRLAREDLLRRLERSLVRDRDLDTFEASLFTDVTPMRDEEAHRVAQAAYAAALLRNDDSRAGRLLGMVRCLGGRITERHAREEERLTRKRSRTTSRVAAA